MRSCIHCYSGKGKSVTYSECVFVGLGIQHANRMRRNIIVLWPAQLQKHFPHFLKKRHDIGKIVTEREMCVLICFTNIF